MAELGWEAGARTGDAHDSGEMLNLPEEGAEIVALRRLGYRGDEPAAPKRRQSPWTRWFTENAGKVSGGVQTPKSAKG